jgi:hypothetical protein
LGGGCSLIPYGYIEREGNMNIRIMLPMREIITIKSGLLKNYTRYFQPEIGSRVNIAKNFHGHKFQFKLVC